MGSMLPNITEQSANRRYLPPIEETYSRGEVDALVAAALAKATANTEDLDSPLRRCGRQEIPSLRSVPQGLFARDR